jgi:hypothetical protein
MLVRTVHTAIYVVVAFSVFILLFGAITGASGWWLWVAAALALLESLVFVGSGMKCPLTAIAVKYGATKDGTFDTFLPERCTRHTLRVFGPLMALGFALIAWRWWTNAW